MKKETIMQTETEKKETSQEGTVLETVLEQNKIKLLIQFIKFGIVGLSNTILSYVLYIVFLFALRGFHWSKDYMIANVTAFTISIFWSFYWNNRFVFKREKEGKRKLWAALGKCFLSYGFTGYILENVLSFIWIDVLGISKFIAPALNLIFTVPTNFLLNKLWAFKD